MKRADYTLNLTERPSKIGRISTCFDFKAGSLLLIVSEMVIMPPSQQMCIFFLKLIRSIEPTKEHPRI